MMPHGFGSGSQMAQPRVLMAKKDRLCVPRQVFWFPGSCPKGGWSDFPRRFHWSMASTMSMGGERYGTDSHHLASSRAVRLIGAGTAEGGRWSSQHTRFRPAVPSLRPVVVDSSSLREDRLMRVSQRWPGRVARGVGGRLLGVHQAVGSRAKSSHRKSKQEDRC